MSEKKPLTIIGGATGVGKSDIAVRLAADIGGEIISADSMQVYRGFNIGTAKITPEETRGVRHFLIDVMEPSEKFDVFKFKTLAKKAMDEIYLRGKIPIIAGGTGFYIQSVLYDIEFSDEDTDDSYRKYLESLSRGEGPEFLYDILEKNDPESAKKLHPNNVKRVIRALEYLHNTGALMSEHNSREQAKASPYNFAYFVLDRPRRSIYENIEKRVDKMIESGLEAEIRGLIERGVSEDAPAMQGIGYKEMLPYIDGRMSLDSAVYNIKINTRHYAKRQITWFKREPDAIWLCRDDFESADELLVFMKKILKEKGIGENV